MLFIYWVSLLSSVQCRVVGHWSARASAAVAYAMSGRVLSAINLIFPSAVENLSCMPGCG